MRIATASIVAVTTSSIVAVTTSTKNYRLLILHARLIANAHPCLFRVSQYSLKPDKLTGDK